VYYKQQRKQVINAGIFGAAEHYKPRYSSEVMGDYSLTASKSTFIVVMYTMDTETKAQM
jgi:hypothetical protein